MPALVLAQQAEVETFHVQGNVYMLIGAGANIAVQTGDDGVLVVDTGTRAAAADVLAAIRRLSDKPIRWIINTQADADHTGGNETISQAGITVNGNPAAIVAHERTLARMSDAGRSVTELPLTTFFEEGRDFYFNGEAIFLRHIPHAHTDGDILVHFRGSDVLVAGDIFVTTTYPIIDRASDGGIEGFIAGLNTILDITVPKYLQEGGTYVVPGHGRVADEADVVAYRDMALIVRDRVRALREQGMTLGQVIAARPALDYEPRYDRDGKSTAAFIEAVYATVEP
ncbi:MAG TPA: MBL fold metallo-hydrolase [Gammaproteobacteria bacterium]|jgi:glyoxylase-like metal-dependent hydrolase (beta-lactamase superfamily II)